MPKTSCILTEEMKILVNVSETSYTLLDFANLIEPWIKISYNEKLDNNVSLLSTLILMATQEASCEQIELTGSSHL